jgi:hypothetical protein
MIASNQYKIIKSINMRHAIFGRIKRVLSEKEDDYCIEDIDLSGESICVRVFPKRFISKARLLNNLKIIESISVGGHPGGYNGESI